MNSAAFAQNGLLVAIAFSLVAALFAWIALRVTVRRGPRALATVWVVAAVTMTVLMTFQIHRAQTSLGVHTGAAGRSLGAFWLGVLAFFLVFALADLTSIVR
jgi:hypothetical protein